MRLVRRPHLLKQSAIFRNAIGCHDMRVTVICGQLFLRILQLFLHSGTLQQELHPQDFRNLALPDRQPGSYQSYI